MLEMEFIQDGNVFVENEEGTHRAQSEMCKGDFGRKVDHQTLHSSIKMKRHIRILGKRMEHDVPILINPKFNATIHEMLENFVHVPRQVIDHASKKVQWKSIPIRELKQRLGLCTFRPQRIVLPLPSLPFPHSFFRFTTRLFTRHLLGHQSRQLPTQPLRIFLPTPPLHLLP